RAIRRPRVKRDSEQRKAGGQRGEPAAISVHGGAARPASPRDQRGGHARTWKLLSAAIVGHEPGAAPVENEARRVVVVLEGVDAGAVIVGAAGRVFTPAG